MVVLLRSVFERSGNPLARRKRVKNLKPFASVGVTYSRQEEAEA